MRIEINRGADPHKGGQTSYVSLIGGNNQVIWGSEGHNPFYARRKGKKLGKLMGIPVHDHTRQDGRPKIIFHP